MVQIIADTTSGLPAETLEKLGIPLIPQFVIFGEETYRDDTGLDASMFLHRLRTSPTLPTTAAPAPALYNPVFEKFAQRGESMIVIAPSAKVSGTVRAALTAAQDFPQADIHVVDSQTIAGNLATMVLLADQWAKAGEGVDGILKRLDELIARQRIYFLVATLEYLQKGGRIGGAKALIGELLQVKPILTLREGQVEPFEQQRTKRRAISRLAEIAAEQGKAGAQAHLCVMHSDALEDVENLLQEIRTRIQVEEIPVYSLPPAIVVHAGPGAMGVGFFV